MPLQRTRKLVLSLSIAAALAGGPAIALGDGDRVAELEARVAELEALVQQLLNRPAPPPPDPAAMEARAEAIAEEKVSEMLAEHKAIEAEQEHKHSYKFGGYVKADVIYSDYSDGSSSGAGRAPATSAQPSVP